MRNLAKLILFFTLTFIIIFAAVTCLKLLALRVDWAKSLPPGPETVLISFTTAAHWALSLTLFSSILITLNYIIRRKFFPLVSIIVVITMSFTFCYGISLLLNQLKSVRSLPAQTAGIQFDEKGLILSNSMNRNVTAIVLLDGTASPYGPRVMSVPGQPLVYHESIRFGFDRTPTGLPPIPFGDDTPWFLKSLTIDIRLNAEMFQKTFEEGISSFLIYAGSLIFLLCSLGYAFKFSVWPLANLFMAALAFRGILAVGTLLNSYEMQNIIESFLNNIIPVTLALPLLFTGFGILVYIYSILAFLGKRRVDDDY